MKPDGGTSLRLMLVGVAGFEPATLCSQSRCATWLRHTPYRFGFLRES